MMSSSSQFTNKQKYSPNSPLIRSPYIKLKIEIKKINTIIKDIDELNPYCRIILSDTEKVTKVFSHVSSPRFLDEFQFDIKNSKEDNLLIEVFTANEPSIKDYCTCVGFQLIPIRVLEQHDLVGERFTMAFRLILTNFNSDFFSNDPQNNLHIKKHDPMNYKLDKKELENSESINIPYLVLNFEYYNFYHLWKVNIRVHSIIEKTDIHKKLFYFYKLFIKRNDGLEWFKEVSFEMIENFRDYICQFFEKLDSLPFPRRSILRHIPIINKYYTEESPELFLERKVFIETFFEQLGNDFGVYKFDEFNNFLSSD